MSNYNFSTLNDKDLEDLVRDLLSHNMGLNFQKFKKGKDGGIDLRYSTPVNNNNIIVQVKHYLNSGFNALIIAIEEEKKKIVLLNPNRYIIVTSLALTPQNKDKIKQVLSPYILDTGDILGQDDLNILLSKYPNIEQNHYKLWMSSVNVLQTIVNNGILGRSAFESSKIKRNLGIYVKTKCYDEALEILRNNKILLITGTPGIGKTSLANLVTYNVLSKDFQLVYIDSEIKEAEAIFCNDHSSRQLFYFDDFLGSNYLDIIHNIKGKSIVNFIDRVKSYKNKYLILTTRSTILNQAKERDENIHNSNLSSEKYELSISNYSKIDKAKILYNHLYHSDMSTDYIDVVFQNKNYMKIIKHENYNPRLIEFFTKSANVRNIDCDGYLDFILQTLDNPARIWEQAFENQLTNEEKILLQTLLTMGQTFVTRDELETAFNARIDYEINKNGFTRGFGLFNKIFNNLLDGYIVNSVFSRTARSVVNFVNPSLRDYLISFFNKNPNEKWRLIESAYYLDQIVKIFSSKRDKKGNIFISNDEIERFINTVNGLQLVNTPYEKKEYIDIEICCYYCDFINRNNKTLIENIIKDRLMTIDLTNSCYIQPSSLLKTIEHTQVNIAIKGYFISNWDRISEILMTNIRYASDIDHLKKVFSILNMDYDKYRRDDEVWLDIATNTIDKIYRKEADEIWENKEPEILDVSDADDIEQKIFERLHEISELILPRESIAINYSPKDQADIDSIIAQNRQDNMDCDFDIPESYEREIVEPEDVTIENLFSR